MYNNNIAFQSQASWGRLKLKPNKSHKLGFRHMKALLSRGKSLGIFHPFKSPFIASYHVNFGLPLHAGASGGLLEHVQTILAGV
jgi:hypothetical protein